MPTDINILNIANLQLQLTLIDKIKCCRGAIYCSDFPDIRTSFGVQYVEANGQWRHSNCTIVLQDDDK